MMTKLKKILFILFPSINNFNEPMRNSQKEYRLQIKKSLELYFKNNKKNNKRMGNHQSQFESEFYNRYSYIQNVEDQNFGGVKVYRKNTFRYDYIMIIQIGLQNLNEGDLSIFQSRLERVTSYQNETTMRVFYHKLVTENTISCRSNKFVIYAEYLNRTLNDYLCALRSNPTFMLDLDEIIYVLKQISKCAIILQKMGITNFPINSNRIFLSIDGETLLCPLLYLLQSLKGSSTQNQLWSLQKDYQKYSVTHLCSNQPNKFPQKRDFHQLLMQLSGSLPPNSVKNCNFLTQIIEQSDSLERFHYALPQGSCENIHIEQMYRSENLTGQFYSTQ